MANPAPGNAVPTEAAAPRPIILVVDDDEEMRNLLATALKSNYAVRLATGGVEAIGLAEQAPHPDLILLDIEMPSMDGYAVCRLLKANPVTRDIPVIFVTVRSDPRDEAEGLKLGAVDYIEKPVSLPIVAMRVRAQLAAHEQHRQLEAKVAERTRELQYSRLDLIRRLARAMEYREGGLTNRVARHSQYVKLLALAAGARREVCELLTQASPLHDIGTLGVAEVVLRKTDRLSAMEWIEMRKHPEIGATIIGEHRDPLLQAARIMALTHHERWDGKGYPKGLAGDAIPWPGRVMAIADAFEAMTATQRYRAPLPVAEAAKRIAAESGKQFDPKLVEAFGRARPKMIEAKNAMRDELEGIHDLDFSASEPQPPAVAPKKPPPATKPAAASATTARQPPRK
jgi:putative two-component system response regulator